MIIESSLVCLTLVDEILHVELHLLTVCNLPNMKYTIFNYFECKDNLKNSLCQSIYYLCFCTILLQNSC